MSIILIVTTFTFILFYGLSNCITIDQRSPPQANAEYDLTDDVFNDERMWENFPPDQTNCTENVYAEIEDKGFILRPELIDPAGQVNITLSVRFWYPPNRCYLFGKVPFYAGDTIGDVAARASMQFFNVRDAADTAKLILGRTPLYNNKYMRYFLSNIQNGGILTLKAEINPKYDLDYYAPFGIYEM